MKSIILGLSPFLGESWQLTAADVFARTGGNTGNMAFQYAVTQHIGNFVNLAPGEVPAEELKNRGDIIVLPLANQLGSHTDLGDQATYLEKSGLPIVAIGLGAQADGVGDKVSLSKGTERWLKVISNARLTASPNIGMRGQFSADVADQYGCGESVVVIGCPSNFISLHQKLERSLNLKMALPIRRVAVTAGIPFIPRLAGLERDLAELVTQTSGEYIVQHGLDMIRLARGEFNEMGHEKFDLHWSYIAPSMGRDEFLIWCRKFARCYTDVRAWIESLRNFDFVVGTRFHGAMCAVQSGTPAGVIAHDSRTFEMCETMGIPVVSDVELGECGLSLRKIREIFKFDVETYTSTRRKLFGDYSAMLDQNKIIPSEKLVKLRAWLSMVAPQG